MEKCWVYGDTVGRKILLVEGKHPIPVNQCFIGIPIVTLPGAVQKPSKTMGSYWISTFSTW